MIFKEIGRGEDTKGETGRGAHSLSEHLQAGHGKGQRIHYYSTDVEGDYITQIMTIY